MLLGQLLCPVIAAHIIAWPLAYLGMARWLSGFDERIALTPALFLAPALLPLVVAILTVAAQAYGAAKNPPGHALRYD